MTFYATLIGGLMSAVVAAEPATPAAVPPEQAARALSEIVADASLDDATFRARTEQVAEALPGWRAATRLKTLPADPAAARERVGQIAAMLAFKPTGEAELPEGWPSFTPVGEIQLKQYPAYRAAVSTAERAGLGGMFWILFRHISSNDIPMTAPVDMTVDTSGDAPRMTSMAFLYQNTKVGQPGDDGSVQVVDYPPLTAVSIGMIGQWRDESLGRAEQVLDEWLQQNQAQAYERAGPMRVLGYNGPGVPEERKYYEIQLPVKPRQP